MLIKIIALIAILSLAACGGGGGGGGGGGSSVGSGGGGGGGSITQWSITTTQADVYRTAEYSAQGGLEQIHAAEAYAVLEKNSKPIAGDGVKIGIVDSGIQTNHVDLAANYVASGSYDYINSDSDPMDDFGHGTHVAGIAAGVKNGSGVHGVAYNADILAEKVLDLSGAGTGSGVAAGITNAANNSAKIINLSLGGGADADMRNALLTAKASDALTLAATGNDSVAQPDYPARYASDASLTGYVLAVAAVNSGSTIASFSNFCGDAKDYCLAAPGVSIYGASSDANFIGGAGPNGAKYATISGTSMATPQVAGAAAVIRAAWPILTAPQVTQILLTTATDLGAAGVDTTYGHGLLNLYAAVQAQGQNLLGYGANIYSGGYDVNSSSFSTSSIFGDAFVSNVAPQLNDAVFFDDYGRDYKAFLGNKISAQNNNSLNLSGILINNFQTKSVPLRFGFEGRNNLKLNYTDYRSGAQNFARIDKSQDPQNGLRQGFSFTRNSSDIAPNLKFGFAINVDEIAANQKEFGDFGFISQNNLGANPYQSFLQNNQQRNFNQLFVKKDFFANKFSLNFSYQSSYESAYASGQIFKNLSQKQNQITDVSFAFKPEKFGSFLVSLGNLTEFNNNLLNSKSLGAFESAGNAKTSYVKFSANQNLFKNLFLISSYSEGVSKIPGNSQGIFRSFNDVRSRSASVGLVCDKVLNGKIGLNYLEPMRVYRGIVDINIPTAIDVNGNLIRYQTTASLAPKGKEQDFDFFYSRNLNEDSHIKFNFVVQKNAGNNINAPTNYLGMMQYSLMR